MTIIKDITKAIKDAKFHPRMIVLEDHDWDQFIKEFPDNGFKDQIQRYMIDFVEITCMDTLQTVTEENNALKGKIRGVCKFLMSE